MEVLVIDHVEKPTPNQEASAIPTGASYEAVSVKLNQAGTDSLRTGNGEIRQRMHEIGIHIADPTFYIHEGGAIDEEATRLREQAHPIAGGQVKG